MKHFATPEFWFHYRQLTSDVKQLADKNFALLNQDPASSFSAIEESRSILVGSRGA
jgi:hypothetical protein